MEWAYRLFQEPGRLWKRYLFTNALFIVWMLQCFLRNEIGMGRSIETLSLVLPQSSMFDGIHLQMMSAELCGSLFVTD